VANGTWIDRSLLPTASLLKNGKIVRGRVVQVDSDARTVTLEDQSTLPYDVLVIATGARNLSPGEPPLAMTSKEDTVGFFRATRNAILESKDIVVLGAGPVAIELAGELRAYTKASMNVTLCPGEHPFLKNVIPPLPKQVQKSIRDMLKEAKVGLHARRGTCRG
jgi:NADH dehydrogenase FAD-containing subunit